MGIARFPIEKIRLTVPKKIVGEPFSVSLISGIEKVFASEAYVTIFDFLSKVFCLTVPKVFVREPFCAVFHFFVFRKSMDERMRVSRFSVEIYLSHSAEKFCRRTLQCFINFGYRKRFCFRGLCHDSRFSVEYFLSHSAEKFCRLTLPCCVSLILGIEKFG